MIFKKLTVGPLDVNCYIIGDEKSKQAVCIDPGGNADEILRVIEQEKLSLKYIINTHGHFDHVGGNGALKKTTGARLAIHKEDAALLEDVADQSAVFGLKTASSPQPDILLKHGDNITLGNLMVTVIHTPGHTRGGICLLIKNPNSDETLTSHWLTKGHENSHPPLNPLPSREGRQIVPSPLAGEGQGEGVFSGQKILFTGDTLFADSIGRTDLPGGSYKDIMDSIKGKILPLGDDVRILSGHGPETTIEQERKFNQFLADLVK